jgi:hypothetical protein
MSGDYRGTEDTCRRLIQFLQGDLIRERFSLAQSPAVLSRAFLARSLAERGVFHEGEAHGHDAVRIAEALDHPFSLVEACQGLAYLHGVRGELSQAVRLLERAVALCRDWNITATTMYREMDMWFWLEPPEIPRGERRPGAIPLGRRSGLVK